ncbi:MAG: hypothetical protein AB7G76_11205 [Steroidobacteraceae bacterium]
MTNRHYNVLFFRDTFRSLERRIQMFTSLPVASLDRLSLTYKIRDIGKA